MAGQVTLKAASGGTLTITPADTAGSPVVTIPATTGTAVVSSTAIGAVNSRLVSDGTSAVWQANWFTSLVFSIDMATASGTQTITGVGFKPKCASFIASRNGGNSQSQGFDNGTNPVSVLSVIQGSLPTYYNETGNSIHYDTTGADTNTYRGKVTSWNDDGFTITWTKVGSPTGTLTVIALLNR